MNKMLEAVRETLAALKEIMITSLQLARLARRYPVFFGSLATLFGLCGLGIWLSYYHPQAVIRQFYSAIGSTSRDSAWLLLDPSYQKRWKNDPKTFGAGYSTTVGYGELTIENTDSPWNPLQFLQWQQKEYDVSFRVEDRFSRSDAEANNQQTNALWLKIAHPHDYERLIAGTLENGAGVGNPTLLLKRRYKQKVALNRSSFFGWRIANMTTLETAIILD